VFLNFEQDRPNCGESTKDLFFFLGEHCSQLYMRSQSLGIHWICCRRDGVDGYLIHKKAHSKDQDIEEAREMSRRLRNDFEEEKLHLPVL